MRAALLLATAAAAATATTGVHCEAQNNNSTNEKITEAEVRQAIRDLWLRVDEQLHRFDASQPQGQSLLKLPEPVLEFTNDGQQVTVTFDVPQQLNVHGASSLLRKLLSSPQFISTGKGIGGSGGGASAAASTSETSSSGPKGVARRLRRSSSTSNTEDSVIIDILEPYNQEEPALFEFRGACTRANLNLLEAVMLQAVDEAAADSSYNRNNKRQRNRNIPGWFGNLGAAVDDEIESGLEEFFEPLREMMREFEKMHGGRLAVMVFELHAITVYIIQLIVVSFFRFYRASSWLG
jgi:hypothetical protein